jgi:hypothetical protein
VTTVGDRIRTRRLEQIQPPADQTGALEIEIDLRANNPT